MTGNLAEEHCEACEITAIKLSDSEVSELMNELDNWNLLKDSNDVPRLSKVFKFKNFAKALEFTNAVGQIAEDIGHHPLLTTEWGKVTVQWWSHSIKGLHRSDFILAARTDKLV